MSIGIMLATVGALVWSDRPEGAAETAGRMLTVAFLTAAVGYTIATIRWEWLA